jgi:hypothetical protein
MIMPYVSNEGLFSNLCSTGGHPVSQWTKHGALLLPAVCADGSDEEEAPGVSLAGQPVIVSLFIGS